MKNTANNVIGFAELLSELRRLREAQEEMAREQERMARQVEEMQMDHDLSRLLACEYT